MPEKNSKWVIRWQCQKCKLQFVETRPIDGMLNAYEIGQTISCDTCGHVGFDCVQVQAVENPQPTVRSSPNLFGGIRP